MTYDQQIEDIQQQADGLNEMLADYINTAKVNATEGDLSGSAEGLTYLLYLIRDIKARVKDADDEANPALVEVMDHMGEKQVEYGSISVERKISNYRTNWQNQVLIRAVVTAALDEIEEREFVDQESGSYVSERAIVAPWVDAIISRLLECAAFRDWRVTALRNNIPGLNPDDFCEVRRSTKAVLRRG